MTSKYKEIEDETKEAYLNFINQNNGYDFNNELFFDFQTLEQVYDNAERRTRKETLAEVEKIIDEFKDLRLYRSKSCQLLLRRLRQKLKEKNE